ncbi:MAG: serine/threonine-protein kinase, partial [Acidobacteriota bacterium]
MSTRRYHTAVALSSGGTAEIYKAWDSALGRDVALKFLRRDDPALVERMSREARAQARLDHPGICQVYEVGELDGRPFIAMEYVDGFELGVVAPEMHLEDKLQVVVQVAEAMHHAHQQGLVHRDLKPSNIMVEIRDDGTYRPVVVDFGLVYESIDDATAVTHAGQVLGTPPYLAPEQVEGRRDRLDRRTDVYGLGATFYELLTGRPPFVGERTVDLLIQTLRDDPVPPRRLVPSLPTE